MWSDQASSRFRSASALNSGSNASRRPDLDFTSTSSEALFLSLTMHGAAVSACLTAHRIRKATVQPLSCTSTLTLVAMIGLIANRDKGQSMVLRALASPESGLASLCPLLYHSLALCFSCLLSSHCHTRVFSCAFSHSPLANLFFRQTSPHH